MCGLVAIISKTEQGFTQKELDLFSNTLYMTAIRGTDSTGCFSVTNNGNVNMLKTNKESSDFIRTDEYKNFILENFISSKIMVGHCRSATKGKASEENAHPFIAKNIVLVHNGTLYNHTFLANTETDSEAITIELSKKSPENVLPTLFGAFALIWYNAKTKLFHIARNKERPLYILQTPQFDFIASEAGLLEWLYYRTTNKNLSAAYFKTDTLYTWNISELNKSFDEKPLKKTPIPTLSIGNNSKITQKYAAWKDLMYGDSTTIHVTQETNENNTIYLEGTSEKYPGVLFKTRVMGTVEERQNLLDALYINGKVTAKIMRKQDEEPILFLSEPIPVEKPLIKLTCIKGETIYINNDQCYCNKCLTNITEKDSNFIWFRKKQNQIKHIYCPSCTEKLFENTHANI